MIRATRLGGIAERMDQIRAEVDDIDQSPVSNPN